MKPAPGWRHPGAQTELAENLLDRLGDQPAVGIGSDPHPHAYRPRVAQLHSSVDDTVEGAQRFPQVAHRDALRSRRRHCRKATTSSPRSGASARPYAVSSRQAR